MLNEGHAPGENVILSTLTLSLFVINRSARAPLRTTEEGTLDNMEKANIPPPSKPAFHAVDQSSDPARLVSSLSTFSALSSVKSLKKKATKRLAVRESSFIVNLGCGLGDDAITFARVACKGMVIAIDSNSIMVAEAEKRKRCRSRWTCADRLPGSLSRLLPMCSSKLIASASCRLRTHRWMGMDVNCGEYLLEIELLR